MKTIFDHIEHIKSRPHPVRRRIAFASAAGGAGVIALVWFFGVFASGTFAIQGTNFAESTGAEQSGVAVAAPSDNNSGQPAQAGLAGAAAAISGPSKAPGIEIVDATSSAPARQPEPTVIPF